MRKQLILLCFFCMTVDAMAAGLGRLFFTPTQRAQLDEARARRDVRLPVTAEDAQSSTVSTPKPPSATTVTYGGIVQRSDGKSTVWINAKPINERNRLHNETEVSVMGMRRDGALSIALPQAGRSATLKVGQSLDITTGRIEESYARHMPAPVTPSAPPAPAAPPSTNLPRVIPRPSRPTRQSFFKESDADSGAAPAERRAQR